MRRPAAAARRAVASILRAEPDETAGGMYSLLPAAGSAGPGSAPDGLALPIAIALGVAIGGGACPGADDRRLGAAAAPGASPAESRWACAAASSEPSLPARPPQSWPSRSHRHSARRRLAGRWAWTALRLRDRRRASSGAARRLTIALGALATPSGRQPAGDLACGHRCPDLSCRASCGRRRDP